MRRILFIAALALASPAIAQQQDGVARRVGAQIGDLTIQNAMLLDQIERMQAQLKAAQDRVKVLEDKYEQKPPPAKP